MGLSSKKVAIYLEIGKKRTFAGAVDWPGWCRSGRDETAALQALADYAPRYARVLQPARLGFQAPDSLSALTVVERLEGTPTTDFGAPDASPSVDAVPVGEQELQHLQAVLQACWQAFDAAVKSAAGKDLRKGPRGGGRETVKIVQHVLDSEQSYLASLGWKRKDKPDDPTQAQEQTREAILDALTAAARGELPAQGPRGGIHWTPRYFTRRTAWHILDHTWEIEDRII